MAGEDMPVKQNPFTPSFGATPPVFAGREALMATIETALASGPTHPAAAQLVVGFRGVGKTVALNVAGDMAKQRKWAVLQHDASIAGWVDDLAVMALNAMAAVQRNKLRERFTGVQIAGTGISLQPRTPEGEDNLRLLFALEALCESLAKRQSGLLICIDEFHSADVSAVREFGSVLQLLRRQGHRVVFLGAALLHIEELLADPGVPTFLQRLTRQTVAQIEHAAAERALRRPLIDLGVCVSDEAIRRAAAATAGHPYMIQLVGFHAWEHAEQPEQEITLDAVQAGIESAEELLAAHLFEPMWRSLSDKDREFAAALAIDDAESRLGDLAERCGVTRSYAGVYRKRLIDAGIAVSSRRGYLRLAHPAMRDWLRSHIADSSQDGQ